jgi:hypothetical protein
MFLILIRDRAFRTGRCPVSILESRHQCAGTVRHHLYGSVRGLVTWLPRRVNTGTPWHSLAAAPSGKPRRARSGTKARMSKYRQRHRLGLGLEADRLVPRLPVRLLARPAVNVPGRSTYATSRMVEGRSSSSKHLRSSSVQTSAGRLSCIPNTANWGYMYDKVISKCCSVQQICHTFYRGVGAQAPYQRIDLDMTTVVWLISLRAAFLFPPY